MINIKELATLITYRLDFALSDFTAQCVVTNDKETVMRSFRCFQSQLIFARDLLGTHDGQTLYDEYRRKAFLILKNKMDTLK